jgi:hypothetical protein
MTIWNQLRDAVRMQIEDLRRGVDKFFRVPWPGVVLMFIVVAGLSVEAFCRIHFYTTDYFWPRLLLISVMILLARAVRYYLP